MFTAGVAASSAESRKISKYADVGHTHIFITVAIETLGFLGSARSLPCRGFRGPTIYFFLRKRLDDVIQRENFLSVLGTFASVVTSCNVFMLV